MARRTKSEPVVQLPNGNWVTKATGMPVTVNAKHQIASRFPSEAKMNEPGAQILLKKSQELYSRAKSETRPAMKKMLTIAGNAASNE